MTPPPHFVSRNGFAISKPILDPQLTKQNLKYSKEFFFSETWSIERGSIPVVSNFESDVEVWLPLRGTGFHEVQSRHIRPHLERLLHHSMDVTLGQVIRVLGYTPRDRILTPGAWTKSDASHQI